MKYLLDFLAVQADEKFSGPSPDVLTELTEPPNGGEKSEISPYQVTDRTDRTPHQTDEPDDWPESWWADFGRMKASNLRAGHHPGEAARLAYEDLKARAAGGVHPSQRGSSPR